METCENPRMFFWLCKNFPYPFGILAKSCYNWLMNEAKLKDGERVNQLFSTDVKIIQNSEVFSYSVDSVLLSRFPKLPQRGLIVDLCAGNGAVGLFASTRTKAKILAVEIQERLADMAERSIELKSNGRLAMVHRPERFLDILDTMQAHNLAPKRIQFVYPKLGKEANMLLIEAIKDGSRDGLKILPPLFIHNQDGSYTPEIHEIYYGK